MKLNTVEGVFGVGQSHDHPVVTSRRDGQAVICETDHQRMIPGGFERGGEPFENTPVLVMYLTGFAMNRQHGPDGGAAEHLIDALHAKTDAQDGDVLVEFPDQQLGDAGVGRILGAGADEQIIRLFRCHLVQRDPVASIHLYDQVILHEHLDQVVGKRIVIVDHQ